VRTGRIVSLDIIRGAVMVLMAIDHVRVYSGLPAGGPTPGIFFTRWITNFCAPAFIFLAGTAAYLHGRKLGDRGALARFLAARGIWLVLLELTVLRLAWTFNLDWAHYNLAGVIWVIGWCFVLLAALVFLPVRVVGAIGVAVIALHNVVDYLHPSLPDTGGTWLLQILYFGGAFPGREDGMHLMVLYSIVPWIGVMAAGYAFGAVMTLDPARRRRICLSAGIAATLLFVGLRAIDGYGDPRKWHLPRPAASAASNSAGAGAAPNGGRAGAGARSAAAQRAVNAPRRPPAALRFLATTKYPASLLFLLMTLGPTIALIPLVEGARGRVARTLEMFGRVPFFFYMVHIPLIHLLAVVVSILTTGGIEPWLVGNHPAGIGPAPASWVWSLGRLYLVWAIAIAILYGLCHWYAAVKQRSRNPLLSYL
jgi:uncharacterized membrane protein